MAWLSMYTNPQQKLIIIIIIIIIITIIIIIIIIVRLFCLYINIKTFLSLIFGH